MWYSCGRTSTSLLYLWTRAMGTVTLAPGYSRFQAFCVEENIDPNQDDKNPLCLSVSLQEKWIEEPEPIQLKSKTVPVDFDLQGPPTLGQEFTKKVEEVPPTEASVEFLIPEVSPEIWAYLPSQNPSNGKERYSTKEISNITSTSMHSLSLWQSS